jgi:hypothetical protein
MPVKSSSTVTTPLRRKMTMEESRMKEIEEKLQHLIISETKSKDERKHTKSKSNGARVIRRRKGTPDLKIV